MSKISSLIRRAPRRFSAVVAMIAAAVIVPAAVFAWGPNRPTFTVEKPASYVTFNSITNNPNIGDERNFVGIREVGSSNVWHDDMTVQKGKEYFVRMYVHNNAAQNLNLVAENVTAKFNLPTTTAKSIQVNGFLSASNASPAEVYDHATFKSAENFNLSYIKNSLKYENNVFGAAGTALPESIFTSAGAKLGYNKLDGKIPGCFEFAGYVTFKVKPQFAQTTNFTLDKKVSKKGENKWVDTYKAQPGEEVDFLLAYKNTGEVPHKDVTFRDTLPAGLSYVPGTNTWSNASTQNNKVTTSNLTNGIGVNVGAYAPGANAFTVFTAKVADYAALKCGTNTLLNKGKVNTGGYAVEDTATVTVDKTCEPPKPIFKYTCDNLTVQRIERTKFRFTTAVTTQNATFKSVTYIIRDASGKEVERKTARTFEKSLDYTQTTAGKYTVEAVTSFLVNGQTKTVTSAQCKAPFEVTKQPVTPVYTCDNLTVKRIERTKFQFTTNYSVDNATFKNVVYVIRDAQGKEIERKTSTAKTLDYTQTTVGNYSVEAIVTVTVNGQDKTVTSAKCKQAFEVPAAPEYCPIPGKEHLPKDSPDCKETPVEPPVTPPTTPPELPHTGAGDNIVAILGLGALIASTTYYVASRRALGL